MVLRKIIFRSGNIIAKDEKQYKTYNVNKYLSVMLPKVSIFESQFQLVCIFLQFSIFSVLFSVGKR